jgi:hypothetical protein
VFNEKFAGTKYRRLPTKKMWMKKQLNQPTLKLSDTLIFTAIMFGIRKAN